MTAEIVRREYLADGKIVCYRFESVGTEAAEIWFADMVKLYENWDDTKPLLLLLDLCKSDNVYLSAEAMVRGRQISQVDYRGKTALVINPTQKADQLEMFVEKGIQSTRQRDVFTSESEAVAWLLES